MISGKERPRAILSLRAAAKRVLLAYVLVSPVAAGSGRHISGRFGTLAAAHVARPPRHLPPTPAAATMTTHRATSHHVTLDAWGGGESRCALAFGRAKGRAYAVEQLEDFDRPAYEDDEDEEEEEEHEAEREQPGRWNRSLGPRTRRSFLRFGLGLGGRRASEPEAAQPREVAAAARCGGGRGVLAQPAALLASWLSTAYAAAGGLGAATGRQAGVVLASGAAAAALSAGALVVLGSGAAAAARSAARWERSRASSAYIAELEEQLVNLEEVRWRRSGVAQWCGVVWRCGCKAPWARAHLTVAWIVKRCVQDSCRESGRRLAFSSLHSSPPRLHVRQAREETEAAASGRVERAKAKVVAQAQVRIDDLAHANRGLKEKLKAAHDDMDRMRRGSRAAPGSGTGTGGFSERDVEAAVAAAVAAVRRSGGGGGGSSGAERASEKAAEKAAAAEAEAEALRCAQGHAALPLLHIAAPFI